MRPDKERRKELLRQFKQQEIAEARRRMCLEPDQLRALLAFLNEQLFGLGIGCDHTLSRTRTWAESDGLDAEKVLDSVRTFGGYCDCEVVFNVRPYKFGWQDSVPEE